MRNWWAAMVVGLVLGTVGAEARASEGDGLDAPPAAAVPARASGVEVSVADTISDRETIRGWIEERAASVLGGSERALAQGEVIRIAVSGRAFDYEIAMELVRNGQALEAKDQPHPITTCECGNEELLDRIAEVVAGGVKGLGEVAEREDAARAEAERRRKQQEELQRQEAERSVKQPMRYRPSMLGRAGFGALGAGGVLTLSGIIMAVQPRQYVASLAYMERDWLAPGVALIGIGTSAMATGVAIVIVDAVRCRRNRAQCGARTAAWSSLGTARVVARSGGER